MACRQYDNETLRKISEDANLLEYASQIMEVEKKGEYYFAHCPKHVDNTPSLCFNPKNNRFICYSCRRSGSIIDFLREYEGLSFSDAVEKASTLANIDLSKLCSSNTIAFLKNLKAMKNKKKTMIIHPMLSNSEYSKYSKEPIQEWINEGIKEDILDLFGVRVDHYGNRIIYPVYDYNGNLINVKGRTRYKNYKALKIPKYINYFPVGTMDYFQGLNITLPYIKEQNEVIIFESIKSVMKAFGWGYKNSVSAEKHTLTEEQISLLIRLKVNIVFAFDKDVSYSDESVRRGIEKLKRMTNVYVIADPKNLLGDVGLKNAPVDRGKEIWDELYKNKRKVI